MNHLGRHGMPAGLYADWNDCLRLGKDGESTFVALQFYYAMTILKEFAKYKKDEKYIKYLEEKQEQLGKLIQELCWNEDRFIRGFTERGEVIGKRTDPEANMWLNPQSWAVISGLATERQADLALQMVYERLNTEYGAILMDPPYHQMLSTEHLRLSTMQEQRKMREFFHSHRDGSFWQKHFADMVSVHLIISWRMLRQRRMTGLRSDSWSHTAMDSLQKEKQARISDDLMCTG